MNFIALLFRIFAFLFHLPLALFFFAVGAFALIEGVFNLQFDMLPWSGRSLTFWIFGMGLAGLPLTVLALFRKWRPLFALYALVVFGLCVYAVFFSGQRFSGIGEFQRMLALCAGALAAAIGAFAHAAGRAR
ncbi:MAG: hypothetical protein HY235_30560 [Acidobacteria bacterium]|nr:hypothetical protein [Acidobacteriota bacterium]